MLSLVSPATERGKSWVSGGMGAILKIDGADTGGKLAVVEHPVSPRILVMPHVHEREDEYSYILEGTIGARIGDEEFEAPVGSYLVKPRAVPHVFWNATDRPARILEMIVPAGLERYFEELGAMIKIFQERGPALSDADRNAYAGELGTRYGLRYLPEWIPELASKHHLQLIGSGLPR